jgi:hypothetical protein
MGNRFAGIPEYHTLVKGHGIVAAITFLFIVPMSIMFARFYAKGPTRARHIHIYLQVLALLLSTAILVLGWFAVGPARSLTNPHHGIGVAIYVLMWVQAIGGRWVYGRLKAKTRPKLPITAVLHQWIGRATALLGIVQVALGLTLYGSPKFTFVLYTLWMTVLLVVYFILSHRRDPYAHGVLRTSSGRHGTVIEEKKKSRFGGWLAPLAAGAGTVALLNWRRNRNKSKRQEVISSRRVSRRDSESYIEDEKYEARKPEGGGMMSTVLKGAAVIGAGALAKGWWDRRQERKKQEQYSSVDPDTPSRRHRRHNDSVSSDDSGETHGHRHGRHSLPGPGDPVAAAAAISAAEPRPMTPRPVRHGRTHSVDSRTDTHADSLSPSRRPQSPSHNLRNSVLAGLGIGWFAKMMKDRRDRKEQEKQDKLAEEEHISRLGQSPAGPRYTGDGAPPPRRHRVSRTQESSELSSIIDDPHHIRPGDIPPIPAALAGGVAGAALASYSRGHHDMPADGPPPGQAPGYPGPPPPAHANYPPPPSGAPPGSGFVAMPPAPPDTVGILHEDSGSESYLSAGGAPHRPHSSRRRREGEAAAAAAVAGAAGLAAEEAARRQRSRSRSQSQGPAQPVSVKVKMHGDRNQNVTLRRLTEQEAAAERESRRNPRRQRADSLSSLSGTDTTASNPRRYRRDERQAERKVETGRPPPAMAPLSPPNPAFAAGRRPKDSAYYSGRPEGPGAGGGGGPGSVGSPESHGTWSAMSAGSPSGSGDPAERRRRRRLERNQRPSGTVEYT